MILPCILVTRRQHILSFLCVYFETYMLSNYASRPTLSPTNNKHKQSIAKSPLHNILQFTYLHQNIINTHRPETTHWNERLIARSWPTT
jgi:hypothetical protein